MKPRKITLLAGFILFMIAAGMATWSSWPASIQRQSIDLPPQDFQPGVSIRQQAEDRQEQQTQAQSTLEWPSTMAVGDQQTVRLKILPTRSAKTGDKHETSQSAKVHTIAETRLDMGG